MAWADEKHLPLEPGADPKSRDCEAGEQSMGVTWGSEADWGAKPAEVLPEELELTAGMMGRLVEGGALGPRVARELWQGRAGDSTDLGLGDSILEVQGNPGKAHLASAATGPTVPALSEALACKEPPPSPPFRGALPMGFAAMGGRAPAAAAGAGPLGVGLLTAPPRPGAKQGAGQEGFGDWAAGVPGESCFTSRVSRCAFRPGAGGTGGRGAAPAAGRAEALVGHLGPQLQVASVSPRRASWMRWRAAFFSQSRSSAVTRPPGSGAGGSLRGSPRLCGSRGIFRFRGLEQSAGGERVLRVAFCPMVGASASFSS